MKAGGKYHNRNIPYPSQIRVQTTLAHYSVTKTVQRRELESNSNVPNCIYIYIYIYGNEICLKRPEGLRSLATRMTLESIDLPRQIYGGVGLLPCGMQQSIRSRTGDLVRSERVEYRKSRSYALKSCKRRVATIKSKTSPLERTPRIHSSGN